MAQTSDTSSFSVPVLIVGAGPTGLTAANFLGQYGIQTLLIEQNLAPGEFPRAVSIDDEGLRILQALGTDLEVLKNMRLDLSADYRSRGRLLIHVTPTSRRNGYPLISTYSQPQLERTLRAGLQRFPCVDFQSGHTLEHIRQTEQGILAHVRTPSGAIQQITCTYLLACDGGKSMVRHALNIPLRGKTFAQRWLVVDGQCEEQAMARPITFFCDPERPAVSVPMPEQGWRWEFMLHPGENEEWFCDPANLRPLLRQIGDSRQPRVIRQSIYTFHAARAASFAHGNAFLLGDAAHLLPPFGGQGMCCGLRDASNLSWKLALVLKQHARPDLLQTYQQEQAARALEMIRFSTFLGSIVMPTGRLQAGLRNNILRAVLLFPSLASALTEMRIKPDASYAHGFRLPKRKWFNTIFAGQLLPQPTVQLTGNAARPLDELLGPGFTLLRLYPDPDQAFKTLQSEFWQKLETRYTCLIPATQPLPETIAETSTVLYARDDGELTRFLHGRQDIFVLVRPDRYIYGVFRREQEHHFIEALQQYLN